jgi:hypothetical protein
MPPFEFRIKQARRFLCGTIIALALFARLAFAQGGPPFLSDDPDTPGNKNWEINLGFLGQRGPSEGAYQVPDMDINYGLGHRIQLKVELPLAVEETRGESGHALAGFGNSLLGVKYRFYAHHPKTETPQPPGERESNFGLSVYPQLALSTATRSAPDQVFEPGLLLPMEASAILGPIRVSAEVGYWLNKNIPDSWIRGIIVGHEFKKDTECYLELYDQRDVSGTDRQPKAGETSLGFGGRLPIVRSGSFRLLGMVGHDVASSPIGHSSWIAYVGIQFLSGQRRRHSSDFMEGDSTN